MNAYGTLGCNERNSTRSTPYDALTVREREVFNLVSEGHSSASSARRLSISRRTAEAHRANVMRKLRLNNQIDLVRSAIAHALVAFGPTTRRHAPH